MEEEFDTIESKDPKRQAIGGITGHNGIVYQLQYATFMCIRAFCDISSKIQAVKYQNFTRVDDILVMFEDGSCDLYQCKFTLGNKIQTCLQQYSAIKDILTDFFYQYIEDIEKKVPRKYCICTTSDPNILMGILEKISNDYDEIENNYTHLFSNDEKELRGKIKDQIIGIYSKLTPQNNVFGEISDISKIENNENKIPIINDDLLITFLKNISIERISLKTMRDMSISLINAKLDIGNGEYIYCHLFEYISHYSCRLIQKKQIETIFNSFESKNVLQNIK